VSGFSGAPDAHGDALVPERVEPLLRGRFGRPYLWAEECVSTQEVLRGGDLHEGATAVAEHQAAGRGRRGRQWEDVAGRSVLVSVLLRPRRSASPLSQLSLVVGLAVAEAVDSVCRTTAQIKWPNDVLVADRKVAGILVEGTDDAAICGIGLNVNQSEDELPVETRMPAGSLRTTTGREHDRVALLVTLLDRLQRRYDEWLDLGLALFVPDLARRDALRGRAVTVGDVSGTAAGIAPDGRLRVRTEDGSEALVASGEAELAVDDAPRA
jgi:BirA family transcriptional regulator, biotin operon repressor / biotin---[acetyl-CoA-carboxylase] ligase